MDLFSLGFLLLILVASGFVAFLADRLGKKLGKKRLSIWGLRPKHVAALGTVVMGVVVSGLTIALVAAASRDARVWLREGRQLLVKIDDLRKEKGTLEGDKERLTKEFQQQSFANRELKGTNANLKGVNAKLTEANSGLQASLESERSKLQELQTERGRLVAESGRLKSDISRLGGVIASLQQNQRLTERALTASRNQLTLSRTALRSAKTSLRTYQAQIRESEAQLKTSKINVKVANERLNEALILSQDTYRKLQDAQAEVDKATAVIADLNKQREKAESDLAATQVQYTATQARLDKATQGLIEIMTIAESQQGFLNSGFKTARTEPLTFRAREEVWRVPVPGGADADAARAALTSLIRTARLKAADRGAKSHTANGQTFEVADIFERQDPKTKTTISSEDLKRAVVTRAAGRVEDQVIVATSSYNAFAGEPVSLDIAVLPNPLVYHQGEMLSEARIDGSLPEDEIFAQISQFVRSRVKERATQDRMIPRTGTEAPFGEVPPADVFTLVRDVKRVGRAVRVQAFAGDDIRAADPLRLEFRLK